MIPVVWQKILCRAAGSRKLLLAVFSAGIFPAYGSEFCSEWLAAEIDATEGKYSSVLELRSCDLTGGVSAFLQMKNSGAERLKVIYRAHTEEKLPKDDVLILAPGETKRGATCLQCSRRKGGVKLWEIVAVEVQMDAATSQPSVPADTVSPSADSPSVDASPPVLVKPQPVVSPPVPAVPVKQVTPVSENLPETQKQQKADPSVEPAKAEGDTPVSWDQLPPEFRPRR